MCDLDGKSAIQELEMTVKNMTHFKIDYLVWVCIFPSNIKQMY